MLQYGMALCEITKGVLNVRTEKNDDFIVLTNDDGTQLKVRFTYATKDEALCSKDEVGLYLIKDMLEEKWRTPNI